MAESFTIYDGTGSAVLGVADTTARADIAAEIVRAEAAEAVLQGEIDAIAAGEITKTGSPVSGQVAIWSGASTITGEDHVTPAQGGAGVSLVATGGTSQVVMQEGVGANFTVRQLASADISDIASIYAPLNSPPFTGVPTAPTAAPLSTGTQLATLDFVNTAVAAASPTTAAPWLNSMLAYGGG